MAADESAGSDAASAEPISAVAELVARHRPDSRRLRYLIGLLTEEQLDLAALVERCALPRQTVQAVLSATASARPDGTPPRGRRVRVSPRWHFRFTCTC